jgi:hypothetical protein
MQVVVTLMVTSVTASALRRGSAPGSSSLAAILLDCFRIGPNLFKLRTVNVGSYAHLPHSPCYSCQVGNFHSGLR